MEFEVEVSDGLPLQPPFDEQVLRW